MSDIKSIAQIKQEFEQSGDDKEALYVQYAGDSRKGVQNLITKYQKEAQKLVKERERLETMRFFEHKYSEYHAICGIDEAGRGPLAGPVVAGAVILPEDVEILYLNDSKKLSAARREELYEEIKEKAICYGVGIASPERIDQINILPAPDLLLVDAVHIPEVETKQVGIIKGDAKSVSIAAASIIAKVTRDHMMMEMDALYPEYGFAGHKGYGAAKHIEAIKKYGPCPIHRRTFIKNFME